MARARVTLAVTALLLTPTGVTGAAGNRPPPFPDGFYGNVELSVESGDLGGFEVRFYVGEATGRHMAEFTLCEGWCNAVYNAEVSRKDGGFAFSHVETLIAYADDKTSRGEDHAVEYLVTRTGKRLAVRMFYDGQEIAMSDSPWTIRPLKRPFGLGVARRDEGPSPD